MHDSVFAQILGGELAIVPPQPFADLRGRGPRHQEAAVVAAQHVLDVAHRQPPRRHLDRHVLQGLGAPLEWARSLERNGSSRPAIRGAPDPGPPLPPSWPARPAAVAAAPALLRAVPAAVAPRRRPGPPASRFSSVRIRAASRASSAGGSGGSARPSIKSFSAWRVRIEAGILFFPMGLLLSRRRPAPAADGGFRGPPAGGAPAEFPAVLGLHPPRALRRAAGARFRGAGRLRRCCRPRAGPRPAGWRTAGGLGPAGEAPAQAHDGKRSVGGAGGVPGRPPVPCPGAILVAGEVADVARAVLDPPAALVGAGTSAGPVRSGPDEAGPQAVSLVVSAGAEDGFSARDPERLTRRGKGREGVGAAVERGRRRRSASRPARGLCRAFPPSA